MSQPLQEDLTLLVRQAAAEAGPPVALLWAAALAAGLLALGALAYRRRRLRLAAAAAAPAPAPEDVAIEELRRWRGLSDRARYREAVAAISGTLRRYAEARFPLRASTLTTEEIWDAQQDSSPLPAGDVPFWRDFLALSDWINYAGHQPSPQQYDALFDAAMTFLSRASAARAQPVTPPADTPAVLPAGVPSHG